MKKLTAAIATIIFFCLTASASAALSWGAANGDDINHGSNASLDNLTKATVVMWIYPKSTANVFRSWLSKYDNTVTGWELQQRFGTDGTSFAITIRRATGNAIAVANSGTLVANRWHFLGVTWDTDTPIAPETYSGTLQKIITNVTSSTGAGSGAQKNDASLNLEVGNTTAATTVSANSNIALVAIWNRVLTLGELQQQQFFPHPTRGNVLFVEYGFNGTGKQADWSGQRNNGTVSGPTVVRHAPIRIPFSMERDRFKQTA